LERKENENKISNIQIEEVNLNMIKKMEPLSLAEVKKLTGGKIMEGFLKKFSKIDLKKAEELKKDIEKLDLMKMKKADLVKIIDLMPEDKEELNKIFVDVNLDENETNKLLEVIKKHK